MATIKIKKASEWDYMVRYFKIFIDGQFVGTVASGKTKEFPTTAGQHTVTTKIGWFSSPNISININTDETKYLTISNYKYERWFMPVIFLPFCLFPMLRTILEVSLAIYLLLQTPTFILLFYLITIRKKYFTLSETTSHDT